MSQDPTTVWFEYELFGEVQEETPAVLPKLAVTGHLGERLSRKTLALPRYYARLLEVLWENEVEIRMMQGQIEQELHA